MKILEKFIQDCLRNCMRLDNNNNNKEVWLNQAFGAVQFYVIQNPDSFDEVEKCGLATREILNSKSGA